MNIGPFLRTTRIDKKFTLREIAESTGISYSQIAKIERGEHKPSREKVLKISKKLEVDSGLLLRLSGYDTDIRDQFTISPLIRYKVLLRDSFKCKLCGRKAPKYEIDVDFIDSEKDVEKKESLNNLISLCAQCRDGRELYIKEAGIDQEHLYNKNKLRNLLK
jgi:transcriptional regulator with XRE-family HTH domain